MLSRRILFRDFIGNTIWDLYKRSWFSIIVFLKTCNLHLCAMLAAALPLPRFKEQKMQLISGSTDYLCV